MAALDTIEVQAVPVEGAALPVLAQAQRVDQHPAAVYLARLAPSGRRTMLQVLDVIAGLLTGGTATAHTLPWADLRYAHTQAVRTALAERYSPAGANKGLSALRGVLKEAWRLGLMSAEDYARAVDLERVRGVTLPAGRALDGGELRALFDVCAADRTPAGARDAALLALLYGVGLRRSEAVALDLGDVDLTSGEVRVRRGKGRKDRVGWATNGTLAAVADWVAVRGDEAGPLLVPVHKGGRVEVRRMSGQAVLLKLRARAAQAGVGTFSPHDLRRTFIGDLLDAGVDISTVQGLAGHASVTTTQRYDRRPERVKQQGAARLHVPYTRRKGS